MDWKLAVKEERAALKRMVALLFALADLAESASRRSGIVRRFVIWLLRQAETVARSFATGVDEPSPAMMQVAGESSAEALRLARSFRDLALELHCQATFAFAVRDDMSDGARRGERPRPSARRKRGMDELLAIVGRFVFMPFVLHPACATGPPDTS